MKTKHFLTALFTSILLVFTSLATADSMDLANKRITELNVYSDGVPASTDLIPVWDASAAKVKTALATNVYGIGSEVVTATNVITAIENGTTYYLNSATEFVSTLPAPAAGLNYKFVVAVAPASASYTVVTNASANIILGGFTTADIDGVADVDWESSGGDTITFTDSVSVVGDWVECESDGTSWYCSGASKVYNALTITTAS